MLFRLTICLGEQQGFEFLPEGEQIASLFHVQGQTIP